MIDIHSHFLPGIDDGAKTADESIQMLCQSFCQGVDICVGTPHAKIHDEKSINDFLENREQSIVLLENCLKEKQNSGDLTEIPKLIYGSEIFIFSDISVYDGIEKMCIGDSNYILVELSTVGYVENYIEWLYSLNTKGLIPIIAHIERYPYMEQLDSELSGVDVIYQINSKTAASQFKKKFLNRYYQRDRMVIVSSDMHNMSSRKSCMKQAYDKTKKYYPEMAEQVFCENAKKILGI